MYIKLGFTVSTCEIVMLHLYAIQFLFVDNIHILMVN